MTKHVVYGCRGGPVRRSLVTRIFRSLVTPFCLSLVTLFMSRCISHAQARAKCVSVFLECDARFLVACDAVYLDAHFACAGACKVRVSEHGKFWGRALCVHVSVKSGSLTGSS